MEHRHSGLWTGYRYCLRQIYTIALISCYKSPWNCTKCCTSIKSVYEHYYQSGGQPNHTQQIRTREIRTIFVSRTALLQCVKWFNSIFCKQLFSYRKDNFLTSMSEFVVHKITDRHPEPTKRLLCLTEAAILERDPQTYSVCSRLNSSHWT